MSSSSKGTAREKLAADILKSRGYEILFRSYHTKFNRVDFANKFDIVALKDGCWLFVSVKSNSLPGKHWQELKDWMDENGCDMMFTRFFVWKKVGRKPTFFVYGTQTKEPWEKITLGEEGRKNATYHSLP